jgi:restriction endonuclease S subunit
MIGTIGNPILINTPREFAIKNVALVKFYTDSKIDRKYLKHILDSDYFQRKYTDSSSGSTQKFISLGFIRKLIIPLPGINIQQEIVAQIEKEQQLVDANKQLIQIYEQKTKSKIAEIWET